MTVPARLSITVKSGSIHCGGCVARIERVLSATSGVLRVAADIENSTVRVVFEPERVSRDEIARILDQMGFPVVSMSDE